MSIRQFQKIIWDFYRKNKREFPWRPPSLKLRKGSETLDPYKILISEVMLQQTQTYRVLPKYEAWIKEFPDFKTLAKAPLSKILKAWSGLGYNRRALYLKKIADRLAKEKQNIHHYIAIDVLQSLPGIGPNTAGAVYVFVTNKPLVFIETNIRRTFLHHFFHDKQNVGDKDILKLVEQTLPKKNPREWYYALMDYGSYLSKTTENPNRRSKHYIKQSKFEGSLRQVRGQILRILLKEKSVKIQDLKNQISANHFATALNQLEKEGFITNKNKKIEITKSIGQQL